MSTGPTASGPRTERPAAGRRPAPPRRTPPAPDRYRATLESLFARRRFGIRPGLEVTRALLRALGDPHRRFPSVHVTGSKGKGSTAALTEAILRAHGERTGLFTSPHLASYRDRIQVDRTPIPADAVVEGVERIDALADRLTRAGTIDRDPTFFEVTTALAFDWFARQSITAGVIEVGMGGRLDSTNVLDSKVGVLTTVELEHTELLGPTVEAIAREKAGIFHRGMSGILGAVVPGARAVASSVADAEGVPLWHLGEQIALVSRELSPEGQTLAVRWPGGSIDRIHLPLLGSFQAENAALAVAAAARWRSAVGRPWDPTAVRRGLAGVRWAGRLERIARRPDLYYDVAHTPESARAVAHSLAEIAPMEDATDNVVVFGCLRGKDVRAILSALAPLASTLVVVPVRSDRGVPPAEIRAAAAGLYPRTVETRSAADGVRLARAATAPDGFTLVVGSDYLIGELVRPSGSSDEPDLSDPGVGAPPPSGGPRSGS